MKREKWTSLNMELRSFVIAHLLRLEQTSSSLIRSILRVSSDNLKTLGNKSSALSFKSKIDLLFDLEEIDKTEYNHLIKLMEIRNQFAHNHNAITFESLDEINPDLNKYLLKHKPEDTPDTYSKEDVLKYSFHKLFSIVCGSLLVTEIEYIDGIQEEYKAHINHKLVENIEEIWDEALAYSKEKTQNTILATIPRPFEEDLHMFRLAFRVKRAEFFKNELDNLKENEKAVFRKKLLTEEKLKRLEEEE